MAKKEHPKNPLENVTFEQAIERLSGIVQKIETGQVSLEESLRQYEQGMALIAHCRRILQDAEKRIETINESALSETAPDVDEQDNLKEQDNSNARTEDQHGQDEDDVFF
ncbi:MAG: exodeoxyribonuclease VII small subunit [Planctomycetes bacterium]|jgi:exodeoxyribonuclease VII small subunit|nr:exodeoxyribonuclease VII small subunit [Planctomycetota bacterium]